MPGETVLASIMTIFKVLVLAFSAITFAATTATAAEVEQRCFGPGDDCAAMVVAEIDAARREILVQAYGFTEPTIVAALDAAHGRGVDVRVLLDKSNVCKPDHPDCRNKGQVAARRLARAGVPVRIDRRHAIAHNKVMILDRTRVITGSFNFTSAARRNAENLVVIRDRKLAGEYRDNWQAHADHSAALEGR